MRILIARPDRYIADYCYGAVYQKDVIKFYDILPDVLEDMNIPYKVLHLTHDYRIIHQEPDGIYLAWHNHGTLPNRWFIKSSYIPDYLYFDKRGYGPWSEIVDECNYSIPVELVRKDVEKFCEEYIAKNKSRMKQPESAYGIPDEPYVLVLGQRPSDAVSKFAHIDTMNLLHKVSDLYKGSKYKVCTRGHPLESGVAYGTAADFQCTGNLHTAIANASAVYTVNSGSGFEALLHGKRVFTTGKCDYHWATTELRTEEDLRNSVDLVEEPIDEDNRIQFLHYMLNYHLININDSDSIERKIIRAVMEYEE